MYAVTGATGQLGRLVIDRLVDRAGSGEVVAAVRDPSKAADLAARGIEVRQADYDRPDTLDTAFRGVDRLLLISSNAVGVRLKQHRAAIEAAKTAGVGLLAYTSMLHADATPAKLAAEHLATEQAIAASGAPSVILRNGWYFENQLDFLPAFLERGEIIGAAGDGRFSAAARADFADAAVAVLMADGQDGKIYELAGDDAYTLSGLAAEVSAQSGRQVAYRNLTETQYADALASIGLPRKFADVLADEDACSARDTLYDEGRELSRLIGRPTTTMKDAVAAALGALR